MKPKQKEKPKKATCRPTQGNWQQLNRKQRREMTPSLQSHRMPPRITQKSCRPRVSDRTMVGPRKPTRCLRSFPNRRASNDHGVMKPSSSNRQLLGLSGIRGEPIASPELRLGWMQATIRLLSERKEENSYLTSPLIGLIDEVLSGLSLTGLALGFTGSDCRRDSR
jgi:hypothetical protein